jgi:hypothetical protein
MKWRWNWPWWSSCTESWRLEVHPEVRWPIRAPFRTPSRTHPHLHRHSRPADASRTWAAAINTFFIKIHQTTRFAADPTRVKIRQRRNAWWTCKPHGIPCRLRHRPSAITHISHVQQTQSDHVNTQKSMITSDVTRGKSAPFSNTHTHTQIEEDAHTPRATNEYLVN